MAPRPASQAAPPAGADSYAAQMTAQLATMAAYYGMTPEQYMAASAQSYAAAVWTSAHQTAAASYGMTPEQYMASLQAYAAYSQTQAAAVAPAAGVRPPSAGAAKAPGKR